MNINRKNFINYIIFIIFINIIFINLSYSASTCKYTSEIQECINANKPWAWSWPRSIKDFVCLQSNNTEEVTYQIVLDKKFKKVDKDIDLFLSNLENDKWKYFWSQRTSSFLLGVQDIYDKFYIDGEYWVRYHDLCDVSKSGSILQESMTCLWWSSTIDQSKWFFARSDCMTLAQSKLNIYKKVAINILKSNKHEVRKDDRKKHTNEQKTKYDEVIDLFRINLSYLERILSKLIEKTKTVYK